MVNLALAFTALAEIFLNLIPVSVVTTKTTSLLLVHTGTAKIGVYPVILGEVNVTATELDAGTL